MRTQAGPLRPLYALAYRLIARLLARSLRRAAPGTIVEVLGSLAGGRPVYGLSDIDFLVVARDDAAAEAVRDELADITRRIPPIAGLIFVAVYTAADHARASAADWRTADPALRPDPPRDDLALMARPGLPRGVPAPDRWRYAWPELQGWWSYAIRACAEPPTPYTPYLAVKLVAEPARIWLWAVRGEVERDRRRVLERARSLLPEHEDHLAGALATLRRIGRADPGVLDRALPGLVALSQVLARAFAAAGEEAGHDELDVGDLDATPTEVPLRDWTAAAFGGDGVVLVTDLDPARRDDVAAATALAGPDRYPLLRAREVAVLASPERWPPGALRYVMCAESDPATWALLDGRPTARFPRLPGWSV